LPPELKIILYLFFVATLFFVDSPVFYCCTSVLIFLLLFTVPVRLIKKGWIPILILLAFTFLSNLLFRHGKVLFIAGPMIITVEALTEASIKSMRLLFMIAGAKLLTGTTSTEALMRGLGRILLPLQYVGIPVDEFISTMGLTVQSLPALKEQFLAMYRERMRQGRMCGFLNCARVFTGLIVPLFVKGLQAPEQYFAESRKNEKYMTEKRFHE
jgi:energy-coupling factor transport system permease protein